MKYTPPGPHPIIRTSPLPLQSRRSAFLAGRRVVLGDEMGCGKTVEAIAASAHLCAEGVRHLLLVAGPRHGALPAAVGNRGHDDHGCGQRVASEREE
jgi:hypothetical protein